MARWARAWGSGPECSGVIVHGGEREWVLEEAEGAPAGMVPGTGAGAGAGVVGRRDGVLPGSWGLILGREWTDRGDLFVLLFEPQAARPVGSRFPNQGSSEHAES